jgi:hypothetical protein
MPDIIDSIDATLAERCACGCDRPIDPSGVSAWFAGPDCQWRYHNDRATDPHDVYRRPDAARYPTHDSAEQTLRDMPPAPTSYHGAGVAVDVFYEWSAQERDPDGRWLTSATGAPYVLLDETHVFRLDADTVYSMTAAAMGSLRAAVMECVERIPPLTDAITAFCRYHLPPVSMADPRLDDHMRRALEARRNRNTGPPQRVRVPRRIDATRSR